MTERNIFSQLCLADVKHKQLKTARVDAEDKLQQATLREQRLKKELAQTELELAAAQQRGNDGVEAETSIAKALTELAIQLRQQQCLQETLKGEAEYYHSEAQSTKLEQEILQSKLRAQFGAAVATTPRGKMNKAFEPGGAVPFSSSASSSSASGSSNAEFTSSVAAMVSEISQLHLTLLQNSSSSSSSSSSGHGCTSLASTIAGGASSAASHTSSGSSGGSTGGLVLHPLVPFSGSVSDHEVPSFQAWDNRAQQKATALRNTLQAAHQQLVSSLNSIATSCTDLSDDATLWGSLVEMVDRAFFDVCCAMFEGAVKTFAALLSGKSSARELFAINVRLNAQCQVVFQPAKNEISFAIKNAAVDRLLHDVFKFPHLHDVLSNSPKKQKSDEQNGGAGTLLSSFSFPQLLEEKARSHVLDISRSVERIEHDMQLSHSDIVGEFGYAFAPDIVNLSGSQLFLTQIRFEQNFQDRFPLPHGALQVNCSAVYDTVLQLLMAQRNKVRETEKAKRVKGWLNSAEESTLESCRAPPASGIVPARSDKDDDLERLLRSIGVAGSPSSASASSGGGRKSSKSFLGVVVASPALPEIWNRVAAPEHTPAIPVEPTAGRMTPPPAGRARMLAAASPAASSVQQQDAYLDGAASTSKTAAAAAADSVQENKENDSPAASSAKPGSAQIAQRLASDMRSSADFFSGRPAAASSTTTASDANKNNTNSSSSNGNGASLSGPQHRQKETTATAENDNEELEPQQKQQQKQRSLPPVAPVSGRGRDPQQQHAFNNVYTVGEEEGDNEQQHHQRRIVASNEIGSVSPESVMSVASSSSARVGLAGIRAQASASRGPSEAPSTAAGGSAHASPDPPLSSAGNGRSLQQNNNASASSGYRPAAAAGTKKSPTPPNYPPPTGSISSRGSSPVVAMQEQQQQQHLSSVSSSRSPPHHSNSSHVPLAAATSPLRSSLVDPELEALQRREQENLERLRAGDRKFMQLQRQLETDVSQNNNTSMNSINNNSSHVGSMTPPAVAHQQQTAASARVAGSNPTTTNVAASSLQQRSSNATSSSSSSKVERDIGFEMHAIIKERQQQRPTLHSAPARVEGSREARAAERLSRPQFSALAVQQAIYQADHETRKQQQQQKQQQQAGESSLLPPVRGALQGTPVGTIGNAAAAAGGENTVVAATSGHVAAAAAAAAPQHPRQAERDEREAARRHAELMARAESDKQLQEEEEMERQLAMKLRALEEKSNRVASAAAGARPGSSSVGGGLPPMSGGRPGSARGSSSVNNVYSLNNHSPSSRPSSSRQRSAESAAAVSTAAVAPPVHNAAASSSSSSSSFSSSLRRKLALPSTPSENSSSKAAAAASMGNSSGRPSVSGTPFRNVIEPHECSSLSLLEIYKLACSRMQIKPNSGVVRMLPNEPGAFVSSVNLDTNYIGNKGFGPLLQVLRVNRGLQFLNLRDNNLESPQIMQLCEVMEGEAGESLSQLNLSNNPITPAGGTALCDLLGRRPRLASVIIKDTLIQGRPAEQVAEACLRNSLAKKEGR